MDWDVFLTRTGIGELLGKGDWNISYSYLSPKKKVIVVPSYWFVKSAAVKCVAKVVLVVFSRSRARSRI